MFAFFWYQIILAASIILYIPLKLIGIDYADPIVTIAFFLSSVNFIFTGESMPDKHLDVPSIHHYFRSHNSSYGYLMAGSFFVSALLYVILSSNIKNVSDGIFVLVLWAMMVAIVYLYRLYTGNGQMFMEHVVLDYINSNLKTKPKNLAGIVNTIINKDLENKMSPSEIAAFIVSKYPRDIDINLATLIVDLFYKYWMDAANPLISDEISEANQITEAVRAQIRFEQLQAERQMAAARVSTQLPASNTQMQNPFATKTAQPIAQSTPLAQVRQPLAGRIKK